MLEVVIRRQYKIRISHNRINMYLKHQGLAQDDEKKPIIEYGHDLDTVVVGGYVYHSLSLSGMQRKYIFSDWSNDFAEGNGTLLVATPSQDELWSWKEIEIDGHSSSRVDYFIRALGMDEEGEIYL
jgi:hypothetical protein